MSIKDVTVVITSFKSEEKIKNCLNSIDTECKVIIVENSKDAKFKENIEKEFNNVECILSGGNLGYGKANNIGLKKVKTKYALILNPDTLLDHSALTNLIKAAHSVQDFAIMGPYIQDKNKKNEEDMNLPILTKSVKGFAMFLNMHEFKDIGFFDETFFIYFEEIDLCKRLLEKNKKIYLIPDVRINHIGGKSHDNYVNEEMELSRNWHWMWSTFNYHKKYKGFFISLIIIFPKFISSILKILLYSALLNKKKKDIYYQRCSGLLNAILGKSSWYRPKI